MAYQTMRSVHRPRITQGDELVYFTQSVINMEKQRFQIDEEQKNVPDVYNTRMSPDGTSYTTHDLHQNGLNGNIFTASEMRIPRGEQAGIRADIRRCEENSREKRLGFTSREQTYESITLPQEMPQHAVMPQRHMTESTDSIVWCPSRTAQTGDDCKPSSCSITLSRVYFADASKTSDKLVHTNEYNHPRVHEEILGNFNLPSNNKILSDRQRNWLKEKTIASARRQSAPISTRAPLTKPSSILGGMFPNPQPSGRHRKQANKRSFSDSEEYVYFLTESRKPKSFSRDAICSKSRVDCSESFPPKKRSKSPQEVSDTNVIADEVGTKNCANNEAPLMQVITDSEGRIRVNHVNSPTKDRQHVQATTTSEDYGYLEGNPRELCPRKDVLEINECSSEVIKCENQRAETRNPTSAVITNDHQWDAWKRANCVSIDSFNPTNYYMGHLDHGTGGFCQDHLERYVGDENNNDCAMVDTPHLNKIIQTPNQSFPDNAELANRAELAKQNFECDQTTQQERCTRVFDIPYDNCSENDKTVFMNGVCMDTQKSQVVYGQYINVSNHHSRVSNCKTSYESTTSREPVRALKDDAGCGRRNSRQETTITKDNQKDATRKNNVRHSRTPPKNNSNNTLPLEEIDGKESNDLSKAELQSETEDINLSKDTLTKSQNTEAKSRYQCDWPACDKSFRHYSFLVLHKRIHTGERPYLCSWQGCSKQFRRSDDYQRHYRVHTGVKPYVCLLCGKKFKRSDHRLFHYRAIHHVENLGKTRKRDRHKTMPLTAKESN